MVARVASRERRWVQKVIENLRKAAQANIREPNALQKMKPKRVQWVALAKAKQDFRRTVSMLLHVIGAVRVLRCKIFDTNLIPLCSDQ